MENVVKADTNPLGTEKVGKLIAQFAIPAIIGMVVNAIYNLVDQLYIGWSDIGMLGIGATTVAFPMVTIITAVSLMLAVGGASNFNLSLGRGNKEQAGRTAGTAMGTGAIVGVVLMILALIFLRPLLNLFGATEANMEYAVAYARIIVFGIPFQILSTIFGHMIRADGSPKYSMVVMISGAVFNIVFDYVFLFQWGMGIEGIALATSLGMVLSTILGLIYMLRSFHSAPLTKEMLIPRLPILKTICALGLASFFNQIAMTLMQIVLNNTLRHYGGISEFGSDVPIAVVGSVQKINGIFISIIIGIGQGCQPINGFNYGAKKYSRVKQTYKVAVTAATIVSVIVFTIYRFFPRTLLSVFGNNPEMFYEFGVRYLHTFMFMTFFNGFQPITSNFFTSIGKAQKGIFISMTRQIIFLIPLLLILPTFMGLDGVLFAGPISDFAAAALAIVLVIFEMKNMTKLELQQKKEQISEPAGA